MSSRFRLQSAGIYALIHSKKSLDMLVSRYDIFRTIFIKEVPDLEGPQRGCPFTP